jgi:peptide/nickel transport system ATP-binding protein
MSESVLEVKGLKKYFPLKVGLLRSIWTKEVPMVRAVDDVSFNVRSQEIFGLIGESGCGKTTTGRCILRLVEPTAGKVIFKGTDVTALQPKEMIKMRRKLQIIFQDPYESLNPRMSIYDILAEPLQIQKLAESQKEITEKVSYGLEEMGLVPPEEFLYRFPHELSGGQRQRVAVARAYIVRPEFIVADEPASMLDASTKMEVTDLMLHMIQRMHSTFLYITHSLALARYICNRVAVMYLGKIVEMGPTEDVIRRPRHPYTEALIAAVPVPDPTARRTKIVIKGEVPSPINPPPGCRFHPRCPYAQETCRKQEPELVTTEKDRYVACHFALH